MQVAPVFPPFFIARKPPRRPGLVVNELLTRFLVSEVSTARRGVDRVQQAKNAANRPCASDSRLTRVAFMTEWLPMFERKI